MKYFIMLLCMTFVVTTSKAECPYPKHPKAWTQINAPLDHCWSFGARRDMTNVQHLGRDFAITVLTGTVLHILFPNNKPLARIAAVSLSLGINLGTEFAQSERDFFDLWDFGAGLVGTGAGLVVLNLSF